jgi:hypothetical protein
MAYINHVYMIEHPWDSLINYIISADKLINLNIDKFSNENTHFD